MTIARIENGNILEFRELEIQDVPEHKRSMWKPVVFEGSGPQRTVHQEADLVRVVLSAAEGYKPKLISDRQFFQQLAVDGLISPEEALSAVGPGTIPATMEAMIDTLPEAERFPARMLLTGATQFERQHDLVAVLGSLFGWDGARLDQFWGAASAL